MPLNRAVRALILCSLLPAIACSRPERAPKKAAAGVSASASASSATVAPARRAAVARESLVPPPLAPPSTATLGPGGVSVEVLREGTGDSPLPLDTIEVDFSMWTSDGQLAFSSYPDDQPAGFSVSSLPTPLRSLLTRLKVGAHVRFWVPRSAMVGWKPAEWPDSDLVFELELLKVAHVIVRDMSGNTIAPEPSLAPDAAGPPAAAESTASGLKFIYLARGESKVAPTGDERIALVISAYAVEGVEVRSLQTGSKTATTLARAPAKLREVLRRLHTGDQVRIWFPKGQAKETVPSVGSREAILDVGVTF